MCLCVGVGGGVRVRARACVCVCVCVSVSVSLSVCLTVCLSVFLSVCVSLASDPSETIKIIIIKLGTVTAMCRLEIGCVQYFTGCVRRGSHRLLEIGKKTVLFVYFSKYCESN